MRTFIPRRDILPAAQRELWPELSFAARIGFTLYGGTALTLRLGHRPSVDFDFFSREKYDKEVILRDTALLKRGQVLQSSGQTLTISTIRGGHPVKVSFFGNLGIKGRVGEPEMTDDGTLQVASLDDLFATKVKVVLDRAEAKDYTDIVALLRNGESLERALGAARTVFGDAYQPEESLKALTYFGDGDLDTLSQSSRQALIRAASADLRIPEVSLISVSLSGDVREYDMSRGRQRGNGGGRSGRR